LDAAESAFREGFIPRLGFDSETVAIRDRRAEARYEALRTGDVEAYERCCISTAVPGDLVFLGDTARAIEVLRAWHLSRPRVNALTFNRLWGPDLDGIRDDPRFQSALEEILAHGGLKGAQLRRAPAGE
jgi:hypothetical protein